MSKKTKVGILGILFAMGMMIVGIINANINSALLISVGLLQFFLALNNFTDEKK